MEHKKTIVSEIGKAFHRLAELFPTLCVCQGPEDFVRIQVNNLHIEAFNFFSDYGNASYIEWCTEEIVRRGYYISVVRGFNDVSISIYHKLPWQKIGDFTTMTQAITEALIWAAENPIRSEET